MKAPARSLNLYRITYSNGLVQEKHLVDQAIYDEINELIEINEKNGRHTDAQNYRDMKKDWFGDNFFTSGSPLGKAIETGILKIHGCHAQSVIIEEVIPEFAPKYKIVFSDSGKKLTDLNDLLKSDH